MACGGVNPTLVPLYPYGGCLQGSIGHIEGVVCGNSIYPWWYVAVCSVAPSTIHAKSSTTRSN